MVAHPEQPALEPLPGEPLLSFLERLVIAEWRGENEEPHQVPADIATVKCVCGRFFEFAPGQTKARCPGCRCRYFKK